MNKSEIPFSIKSRLKSFKHSFAGLHTLIKEEHNSRVHLVAAIVVIVMGFVLKVTTVEWLVLALTIAFVIVVEIINSSIENLADAITEDYNLNIKKAKDMGAAAVFVSAVAAVIVGVIIFGPKLLMLFK